MVVFVPVLLLPVLGLHYCSGLSVIAEGRIPSLGPGSRCSLQGLLWLWGSSFRPVGSGAWARESRLQGSGAWARESRLRGSGAWIRELRLWGSGAWAQELWRTGYSCSLAVRSLLMDQQLNPCLLHRRADSLPLSHQGSPR